MYKVEVGKVANEILLKIQVAVRFTYVLYCMQTFVHVSICKCEQVCMLVAGGQQQTEGLNWQKDAEDKGDEETNYCYYFYVLFLYIICSIQFFNTLFIACSTAAYVLFMQMYSILVKHYGDLKGGVKRRTHPKPLSHLLSLSRCLSRFISLSLCLWAFQPHIHLVKSNTNQMSLQEQQQLQTTKQMRLHLKTHKLSLTASKCE